MIPQELLKEIGEAGLEEEEIVENDHSSPIKEDEKLVVSDTIKNVIN